MSLRDKIQATLSKCLSLQDMIGILCVATGNKTVEERMDEEALEYYKKWAKESPTMKLNFIENGLLTVEGIRKHRQKMAEMQKEIDALKVATENPPAAAPSLLDRLLAGEFNNLPDMLTYIDKLYEVAKECEVNKTEFTDDAKDKIGEVVSNFILAHANEITDPEYAFSIRSQDFRQKDKFEEKLQSEIRLSKLRKNENTVAYWWNTLQTAMTGAYMKLEAKERDELRKAWAGREKEIIGKFYIDENGNRIDIVEVGKKAGTVRYKQTNPAVSDVPYLVNEDYICEYQQRHIQKYEANKAEYDALFEQKRQARIDKENAAKQAQEQEKQAYNAKLAKYGLTAASKMQAAKKIALLEKPCYWWDTGEDGKKYRVDGTNAEWIESRIKNGGKPDCRVVRYNAGTKWEPRLKETIEYQILPYGSTSDTYTTYTEIKTKTEFDYACHLAGNADEQKAKAKQLLAEIAEYNEKQGWR